jgi:ORF6N domain
MTDFGEIIISLRGRKVILDHHLAGLYGVATKVLNQAVKRNGERFPASFWFQLSREETEDLQSSRSQFVTLKRGQNIKYFPYAFTEHGALMAANVLNSPQAIKMSVALIETFIQMRQTLATSESLARRLAEIERTVGQHDAALKELFRAIKPLLIPPPESARKKIGFHP